MAGGVKAMILLRFPQWLKKSNAQEEGLCRCSTLYPVLNRKYLKENYSVEDAYKTIARKDL